MHRDNEAKTPEHNGAEHGKHGHRQHHHARSTNWDWTTSASQSTSQPRQFKPHSETIWCTFTYTPEGTAGAPKMKFSLSNPNGQNAHKTYDLGPCQWDAPAHVTANTWSLANFSHIRAVASQPDGELRIDVYAVFGDLSTDFIGTIDIVDL